MINKDMNYVIFIAGWNSADQSYKDELELLSQCYPGATVRRYYWNSNTTWEEALTIADRTATIELTDQLNQIPADELTKTVIVGHSLGARIAVNAVANCSRMLGELVIMGSAIDYDSHSVEQASNHVLSHTVNIYSTSDYVLKFYQFTQNKKAFGSQGTVGNYTIDIQAYFSPTTALQTLLRPDYLASFLIPGVGIFKALVTIPGLIAVVNSLKDYIIQSHCVYEYIKALLDYDPKNARLVKDVSSSSALIPKRTYDNIINAIANWYCSEYPDYGDDLHKDFRSMISIGNNPYCDPLLRIERITISINQISPDLYDWNVIIDTLNNQNKCIQVLMNLDLNHDRDFMPRSILNEFIKHNCQYLDCIVYNKK